MHCDACVVYSHKLDYAAGNGEYKLWYGHMVQGAVGYHCLMIVITIVVAIHELLLQDGENE
jgi:hypothetical protein